ncbi:unnamed protein product [Rhizophagus irregularis]|nr:unnamed protein product [Rhizophagus irregularis]
MPVTQLLIPGPHYEVYATIANLNLLLEVLQDMLIPIALQSPLESVLQLGELLLEEVSFSICLCSTFVILSLNSAFSDSSLVPVLEARQSWP